MDRAHAMPLLVVALLLASAFPVMAQGPSNAAPVVTGFSIDDSKPDLVLEKGTTLGLALTAHPGQQPGGASDETVFQGESVKRVDALFVPNAGGDTITVAMQKKDPASWDGRSWIGSLPVDEPRLVVGNYKVIGVAYDSFGVAGSTEQSGRTLSIQVVSAKQPAFTLGLEGIPPQADGTYAEQTFAADDVMKANVKVAGEDQLIKDVRYRVLAPGSVMMGPFTLAPPYIFGPERFTQGDLVVEITAEDRTGRSRQIHLPVFADTEAPVVVVDVGNETYRNAPFDVKILVSDLQPHDVAIVLDNKTYRSSSSTHDAVHPFTLVRSVLGKATLAVTATDLFGNTVTTNVRLETLELDTDTSVAGLELADPYPLVGSSTHIAVTVAQDNANATVSGNLTFVSPLSADTRSVEIPAAGEFIVSYELDLPAGPHAVYAQLDPDPLVNETDDSNQNQTLSFEVYLGRVVHGDDTYHIRADSRGLPRDAVDAEGNSYTLGLEDLEFREVHTFEVDGTMLHWDPASQITTIESHDDHDHDDEEDAPAPALVWVALMLLAFVAVARRR